MSERTPRVTGLELARVLERDGWQYLRQAGSHRHYSHPSRRGVVVTIPVHAGKILRIGTLKGIMRDAGLTDARLRELL